jgi:nitroreductase
MLKHKREEREPPMSDPSTAFLRARYGDATPFVGDTWNSTLTTLLNHRSVRRYRHEPLPDGTLELLVAAAQSAATSSNLQTWSVIAVEDPEHKERLATIAGDQAQIRQAPLLLVWLADVARLAAAAEQRALPYEALDYTEMFVMAAVDATLAAQNAVIAAESLGLGICYIGAMRNRPEDVAAELDLPPGTFAVFGLCVGYPDESRMPAVKPRLPQAAVLHRERYNIEQAEPIADYNGVMQRFYEEQRMRVSGDWVEHSAQRVAGPHSMTGRHRLREALANLGWKLR